jgi:hypothetical protein
MDRTLGVQSTRAARTTCLVAALVLAVPMLPPQAGMAPAGHADEAGDDEFATGFGNARGTAVRVGPSRSGFAFTTDFAVSLADFQNTVARGDSRSVSLGAILDAVAESFDEDGEHVPQNLRIDSRDEDADEGMSREEFGGGSGPFTGAFGSQYVRATEDPFAEVETVMGVLGLEDAIEIEGGHSRATAGLVEAGQREARGEAAIERIVLGGGAVVLEGLEWTATHRSGADEAAGARFELGGIEIADGSVLPDEAGAAGAQGTAEAFDAANEVLAEAGIRLQAPREVVNDQTGEVAMTPLKVSLGPSDGSRAVAGPLSDAIQPIREPLADALIGMDDGFGAALLLFDVGLGAFAGGGEVLLEIGGTRAVTGSHDFDDPFGDGGGGFGAEFGEVPDEATPESEDALDMPSDGPPSDLDDPGAGGDGPSEAPAPDTAQEAGDEAAEEPVTSEPPEQADGQEQLATPAGTPGQRGGQALMAALIALLVAAGLGGTDFLRLRQSQRTIPD